jgi:hypothetical protein
MMEHDDLERACGSLPECDLYLADVFSRNMTVTADKPVIVWSGRIKSDDMHTGTGNHLDALLHDRSSDIITEVVVVTGDDSEPSLEGLEDVKELLILRNTAPVGYISREEHVVNTSLNELGHDMFSGFTRPAGSTDVEVGDMGEGADAFHAYQYRSARIHDVYQLCIKWRPGADRDHGPLGLLPSTPLDILVG